MLDLIRTEVCGPVNPSTPMGNIYFLTLKNDHSHFTFVYLLKAKSEVAERMIEFIELMKTQFHKTPKTFRSDRGGEDVNTQLRSYFSKNGITTQLTVPKTPQKNGKAERIMNRTLLNMVRCMFVSCMLSSSELQKRFWGKAINTQQYNQYSINTALKIVFPNTVITSKKIS